MKVRKIIKFFKALIHASLTLVFVPLGMYTSLNYLDNANSKVHSFMMTYSGPTLLSIIAGVVLLWMILYPICGSIFPIRFPIADEELIDTKK